MYKLGITKECNQAELGYWLDPKHWGNGYMIEAAGALLNYGFEEFKLHRIHARHIARNPTSERVMQKIGMKQVGILREHSYRWGKYEDLVAYGILNREWKTNQ